MHKKMKYKKWIRGNYFEVKINVDDPFIKAPSIMGVGVREIL